MKKILLCVIFALFLLPLAVMGQCGTDNLTAQDAEGTTFNSVKVGPHCWLKPNLSIKLDSSKIYKSEMYPDTDANLATFGRLYDWYTAMNVQPGQSPVVGEHGFVQGICPEGWHLPTEAETRELMNHDAKTLHSTERWFVPGTNTTGFTMLPGGYYNAMKNYGENLGGDCYMWSAQSLDPSNPTVIWSDCHCEYFLVNRGTAKNGMSVRCVYKIYQGEVTTDSANQITSNSATLWGNVTFNGYAESYERGFVYGTDPDNLDQWAVESSTASDETAPFNTEITGLTVATTYYYQAYIINDFDTAWGEVKSFATKDLAVTTNDATDVKSTSATLNGELTKLEGYANVNAGFKYGTSESTLTSIVVKDAAMAATGLFSCDIDGLTANTTYYFKAFAANGTDTVYGEVKNFKTLSINPCPNAITVTDHDNNTYNTIQIGNQCWMAENLRTTKYADGTAIAKGTSTSTETAYRYFPNDDTSKVSTYGHLYNWPAVMGSSTSSKANPSGVQGICPTGWHVPSDAEWTQLTDYVKSKSEYQCNSTANNIAKALASTTGWNENGTVCNVGNNPSGNNATGFSAVPAGSCYGGDYSHFGDNAYFWSATQNGSDNACSRTLYYTNAGVYRDYDDKSRGFSVRCLRDQMSVTTDSASTVTKNSATLHGNVTDMGGKTNVNVGFKYGTSESTLTSIAVKEAAMTATGQFSCDLTGLTANTTYYFKAFAANGTDTVYGEVKNFRTLNPCPNTPTVTDIDNNVYNTVQIGSQCWMKENLRTTKYADGTSIPLGVGTSTLTDFRYFPNGQEGNVSTYGYLYNWKAVMHSSTSSDANPSGVQGVCPTGWHVPSDAEWTQLTDYVKSKSEYQCGGNADNIAKALASQTGWKSNNITCGVGNNPSANNATGFSAVPAGYCYGHYNHFGIAAFFWSATQNNSDEAYSRVLDYILADVSRTDYGKSDGYSVRCLRD